MPNIIVPGGLNTDIIASRVNNLAAKGELVVGEELRIGPGGKSRNVAQMIAKLTTPKTVAMIGKTTKDPLGLWKIPYDALVQSNVDVTFITVLEFKGIFPGVALIPVDKEGNNQIYLLPGINQEFGRQDIDNALPLFEMAKNSGILALSLELPLDTALYTLDKAKEFGIKAIVDPGGIDSNRSYDEFLHKDIFLLKPNEHEAEILSGIKVSELESAKEAAKYFMACGVQNVLITAGVKGAYLITPSSSEHITIPEINNVSTEKDETGCGDQTMATICALINGGKNIFEAARIGIISGTLQFHKAGIVPITEEELKHYL